VHAASNRQVPIGASSLLSIIDCTHPQQSRSTHTHLSLRRQSISVRKSELRFLVSFPHRHYKAMYDRSRERERDVSAGWKDFFARSEGGREGRRRAGGRAGRGCGPAFGFSLVPCHRIVPYGRVHNDDRYVRIYVRMCVGSGGVFNTVVNTPDFSTFWTVVTLTYHPPDGCNVLISYQSMKQKNRFLFVRIQAFFFFLGNPRKIILQSLNLLCLIKCFLEKLTWKIWFQHMQRIFVEFF